MGGAFSRRHQLSAHLYPDRPDPAHQADEPRSSRGAEKPRRTMTRQILHVIDQYKIGGPGKTILNSARFIDQSRYRTHVATFLPVNAETELNRRIREQAIPALYLPDRRGLSIQTLAALRRYIRQEGIHILHCHGYKSEFLRLPPQALLPQPGYRHHPSRLDRQQPDPADY